MILRITQSFVSIYLEIEWKTGWRLTNNAVSQTMVTDTNSLSSLFVDLLETLVHVFKPMSRDGSVRKCPVKFCRKPNLWERENTHKIVNGVRPMLPTSPDLLQIFYYQPGKFLQALNSHPTPNTLKKLHLISYRERFSQKKDFFFVFFFCSLSSSLVFSLFWDEEQQQDTSCIYRNGLRGWWEVVVDKIAKPFFLTLFSPCPHFTNHHFHMFFD